MSGALLVVLVLAGAVFYILSRVAIVVPQQNAYVVERLGKYSKTLSAGFHILMPFVQVIRYRHSLKEDVIVNLQADEPEMPAKSILKLADLLLASPDEVMATLAAPIGTPEDLTNPNVVKVVVDATGHALYFSRAPIPWAREGWAGRDPTKSVLRHFGIYAYRREFLLGYSKLPPSRLEEIEKLEQLRALEAGHRIACTVVDSVPEGIDTPESYAAFVKRWKAGK